MDEMRKKIDSKAKYIIGFTAFTNFEWEDA